MNKYLEEILTEIEKKSKKGNVNIIRIEGIDSPVIYSDICRNLNKKDEYNLIAKLSIEKLKKFKEKNNNYYDSAINYLEENNYIDYDGSMTKIRNDSVNYITNTKKTIILLMGTELVLDTGGLEDFYCINPDKIINRLKKDYSKWFEEIFEVNELKKEYLKGIHVIFKTLFKRINIDLIKFSTFIDELSQQNYMTEQDLCEEIYKSLNRYWSLPAFKNEERIPKLSKLKKAKKCSLIEKSIKFANRDDYKNYLSKSSLSKINKKIDSYAQDKQIDKDCKFPNQSAKFNSYYEFENCLIDYIKGKDIFNNRAKLFDIDFNIIDDILKIKVGTDGGDDKSPKTKNIQISGEPIIVYSKMILESIHQYILEKNEYPTDIEINVQNISLNNILSKDELYNACIDISSFLGGILNFLNKKSLYTDKNELININYKENKDIFDLSNYDNLEESDFIQITDTNNNANSKIKFSVEVKNITIDDKVKKYEFIWTFKSYDSWKSSFCLLNKIDDTDKAPLFSICEDISTYLNCEGEDQFFVELEKINIINYDDEYVNLIEEHLPKLVYEKFCLVFLKFNHFRMEVKNKGFFNTIENTCKDLISNYIELLKYCRENYDNFTSIERKYLYLILNLFIVTKGEQYGMRNSITSDTIVPPYNPIMLEKMKDRMNFIKDGYYDIFNTLKNIKTKNKIFEIIDKYAQLSNITNGIEVLQGENNKLLLCKKVYGFYGLYDDNNMKNVIVSDNVFELNNILEDEEIDKKQLIKTSPESRIIYTNIMKYLKNFTYKIDGLNVLIINPQNIQFVVAGIHSVVNKLKEYNLSININLNIILSDERKNTSHYLKYWLDNYFIEDNDVNLNTFVKYLDFKSKKIGQLIESKIGNEDLAFIYDIMQEKNISFIPDNLNIILSGNFKFPMVHIPQPLSVSEYKRSTIISQFQFDGAKEYTQLVNLINNPNTKRLTYRVAKDIEMTDNFKEIIDIVHEKSNWIICIDEGMDKSFLGEDNKKIISFSTGEGNFGELNMTVSANNDKIMDIKKKLKLRLKNKFSNWSTEALDESAEFCIKSCENLDGSKLLEALNPNDYEIYSFLAYVLTLQTLKLCEVDNNYILRTLVNLDDHRHWFEGDFTSQKDTKSRPDLLLLEIENNENNLEESPNNLIKIKATVIECKMGFYNEIRVNQAIEQVVNGIRTLSENWNPNSDSSLARYWYNQLYRALVFSILNIRDNNHGYLNFVNKLYSILEGNFEIEFSGKVMGYWLDDNSESLYEEYRQIEEFEDVENIKGLKICNAGQLYIQKILLKNNINKVDIEYYNLELDEIDTIDEIYLDNNIELNNLDEDKEIVDINENIELNSEHSENRNTFDEENIEGINEITNDLEIQESGLNNIRIFLGYDLKTKEKIYWEFGNKGLNNRHLLISGNSGMGKTYCIQGILYELSRAGISTVIFDYTDGFTEQKLDSIFISNMQGKIEQLYVKIDKFPINPFIRNEIKIGDRTTLESDTDIAIRLSSTFKNVYNFGDQQKNVIYESIKNAFKKHGDNINFRYMLDEIKNSKNKSAQSVISKIMPFIDIDPFDCKKQFSWKNIIDSDGKIFVIQLTGFDREIQIMLTELILWDIWNYCVKNGDESKPLPIVLDEAQNLDHKVDSPSGKILTEGRKFGIGGIYATQFFKGLNSDEIDRLQQAAQKLYFSPPENSVMEIAKAIDINTQSSKEWAEKLKKIKKGECVSCGSMLKGEEIKKYEPRIIKVASLGERINE